MPTTEMRFPDQQALLWGKSSISRALAARGTVLWPYRMREMTPPQCTDVNLDVILKFEHAHLSAQLADAFKQFSRTLKQFEGVHGSITASDQRRPTLRLQIE